MWVCLCVLERGRENVSHFSTLGRSFLEEFSVLIGSNRAGVVLIVFCLTLEFGPESLVSLMRRSCLPFFLVPQPMWLLIRICRSHGIMLIILVQSLKLKIYKNEEFNILCWNYLLETFGKVLCSSLCLMQECRVCVVKRAYIVSFRLFPCFWQRLLTIPLRQMSYIRLWLLLLM